MSTPQLTASDIFIYENEIRPFLPEKIFDVHVHIQIDQFHPGLQEILPITKDPLFQQLDMPAIKAWWKILFAGLDVSGLVLPMPTKGCDMSGINRYMFEAIESGNRFSIIVGPDVSNEELEAQIVRYKPTGLKPYMCFSKSKSPGHSCICDYLPESQIALADKYGLSITLHVAKPRGMADQENLRDISRLVKQYPGCNFILAHCGRCFIAPNMEECLKNLPAADNLWIDTSAVCDTGVFLHLFNGYDRKKILFGTDLVTAAGFRGSYVRMGMSWDWLLESSIHRSGGMDVCATFAAYENLCATVTAARYSKFSDIDFQNLFYENANRLFKLD